MSTEITTAESEESQEPYWRRVLQQWQASGLTGREFQRRNNLSQAAFIYWKLKLIGRTAKKPTLVPVKVRTTTAQHPARAAAIRIHVRDLFTVELSEGFEATRLREVLAAVRECAQ